MAGITFDGIASTRTDSITFSGTTFQAAGNIIAGGSVTDSSGKLQSASVGSPSTFGAFTQAGSTTTSAGATGSILFGKNFSTNSYYIALSPLGFANGAGSTVPYVSGVQTVSGVAITGAASAVYSYIAIGT